MKKTIEATQKVIKIGSSGAVTIPAKHMRQLGINFGDELKVSFTPVAKKPDNQTVEVVEIAQKLIKRHQKALKNLSQR